MSQGRKPKSQYKEYTIVIGHRPTPQNNQKQLQNLAYAKQSKRTKPLTMIVKGKSCKLHLQPLKS